jgi:exodeoxyribonuclease-1
VREKLVTLFADAEPFTPSDARAIGIAEKAIVQLGVNIVRRGKRFSVSKQRHQPALDLTFDSARVAKLLFRYRARNFPGTLDDAEQLRNQFLRIEIERF